MDALLPSSRTLIGFGLASLLLFGCTEARISGIYKETESTDTAVTAPNTAPDCALLEPEDRSSGPEGATVFLTGTATDAETPNDQLTVDFESDQDGPLDSTAPTTSGDVVLPWSELSVGDHVLTAVMRCRQASWSWSPRFQNYTWSPHPVRRQNYTNGGGALPLLGY